MNGSQTDRRKKSILRPTTPTVAMNDTYLDESNEISTPRPVTNGGSPWTSATLPATRTFANVHGQSLSRKPASPPVVQQQQLILQEAENEELEADHEDADDERRNENTSLHLTSGLKRKTANAVPPQPPRTFLSRKPTSPLSGYVVQPQQSVLQEAENGELEAGREDADDEDADDERETENTGFRSYLTSGSKKKADNAIPPRPPQSPGSFSSPVTKSLQKPTNVRGRLEIVTSVLDDDFGATGGANSSSATTASAEKVEAPPAPASNTQKGLQPKTIPGKSGRKVLDNNVIPWTLWPSMSKRLQAQLGSEEIFNQQEDETPAPRPSHVKEGYAVQATNPWRRTRGINKAMNEIGDEVAVDSTFGATSSRTTLDQPRVPGFWAWGTATSNDKGKAPTEPPSTIRRRKNNRAAVNGIGHAESSKETDKKVQHGGANPNPNPNGNTSNSAGSSAWSMKKTTVEEILNDEAGTLHPSSQTGARMVQESVEMERKLNGLNGLNDANELNGINRYLPSSGSISNGVAGMGMNGNYDLFGDVESEGDELGRAALPIDAPTQPRRYLTPSVTPRKGIPAHIYKQLNRCPALSNAIARSSEDEDSDDQLTEGERIGGNDVTMNDESEISPTTRESPSVLWHELLLTDAIP
ncbi:hypothetical protein JOM56_014764 [Amanita muscaria]